MYSQAYGALIVTVPAMLFIWWANRTLPNEPCICGGSYGFPGVSRCVTDWEAAKSLKDPYDVSILVHDFIWAYEYLAIWGIFACISMLMAIADKNLTPIY